MIDLTVVSESTCVDNKRWTKLKLDAMKPGYKTQQQFDKDIKRLILDHQEL